MAQANGKPLGGIARAFAAMRGRLYTPPNQTISGVDPANWPSVLQPVAAIGPKGSQPLAFSFWQGLNQEITPRLDSELTFADLRDLASYPLARICIENVKDILCTMPWKIQLRRIQGEPIKDWKERQKQDKIIPTLTDFFRYPDGETPWSDWLRPVVEDMLVLDAASILVQRTLSGQVVKLRWTDGAQFLKLVNDQGYTPDQDSPAYTQLWEGIPRLFLTTRQLVYRPSNIVPTNTVSSKLYGQSITQQLATEIRIGQERLRFVLAYYTEGSVPGLVHVIKPGVQPDKINEAMQWMNSELSGDLAKRRQWRVVQGYNEDRDDQIVQLKEPILSDAFDDLHIRKIAFGYGTSVQRLLKAMNRASAESSQDSAEKEGIMPRLKWLKGTLDLIIQRQMDQPNYEMVFDTDDELDAVKQADVDKIRVSTGLDTIDGIREDRGQIPFGLPETTQPIIITTTGAIPLEGSIDRTNQAAEDASTVANKPTPAPVVAGGSAKPKPTEKKTLKSGKGKTESVFIDTDKLTPANQKLLPGMEHRIGRWFKASAKKASIAIGDHFAGVTKMVKADDDTQTEWLAGGKKLPKIESDAIRAAALLGWRAMNWKALADEMVAYLQAGADSGVQTGMDDSGGSSTTEEKAAEAAALYAASRSAEMVGMVRDANGNLVEDPDAHWATSDSTLKDLEKTIAQGVEEGWTVNQIAAVIEGSYGFSSDRATLIAENEMMNAQTAGTVAVWSNLDTATIVRWRVNDLAPREPDECDDYEAQGDVPLGHEFAEGLFFPRAHPRCRCRLEVISTPKL